METNVVEEGGNQSNAEVFVRRRWYHRRDVRFCLIVGGLVALYLGYGYFSAPGRMTPELRDALASGNSRLNIQVTTEFPPEEFHMGIYQDAGSIRGTEGSTTTIYRVKPRDVRDLAQYYWVQRVSLAPSK